MALGLREDLAHIALIVDGVWRCQCATKEGGGITVESTTFNGAGMKTRKLGGRATNDTITVTTPYDIHLYKSLLPYVKVAGVTTVMELPSDVDGVVTPGLGHAWTGIIQQMTPPPRGGDANAAVITIVIDVEDQS